MTSEIFNLSANRITSSPEISMIGRVDVNDLNSRGEDRSEIGMNGIIGSSAALESVLTEVRRVAPTNSTVLLRGRRVRARIWMLVPFTLYAHVVVVHSSA
jgi:transcriptional regulator with GAF, ATPase, and Fis domain